MSTAIDYPQSSEKIVELLETLQREHTRAEARREAREREHLQLLTQLQEDVRRLVELHVGSSGSLPIRGATAGPGKPAAKPGLAATTSRGIQASGLDDWEHEKERLIRQWSQPDDNLHGRATEPSAIHLPGDLPAAALDSSVKMPQDIDWLNYLEHLEPDDPALHDDDVRRQLVARLRRIEVEFSLERAQLARLRTELEERRIEFNHDQRILETKQQAAGLRHGLLPWRFSRFFGGKSQ